MARRAREQQALVGTTAGGGGTPWKGTQNGIAMPSADGESSGGAATAGESPPPPDGGGMTAFACA